MRSDGRTGASSNGRNSCERVLRYNRGSSCLAGSIGGGMAMSTLLGTWDRMFSSIIRPRRRRLARGYAPCSRRISFTRLVIIPWCQGKKVSDVMFCKQFYNCLQNMLMLCTLIGAIILSINIHVVLKFWTCTYMMSSGIHVVPSRVDV